MKKNSLLKLFNEQASQLVKLHPEMEDEVAWCVMCLNSNWKSMEAALGLSDCKNCNLHTCTGSVSVYYVQRYLKVLNQLKVSI